MTTESDVSQAGGRFAGKVALITGSSDRGIGGDTAQRLASEGCAVALVSRRRPERLLKRLARHHARFIHTAGDVTNTDDLTRMVDDCLQQFGKIDVLVNNAGVEVAETLDQFQESEWRQLIEVNLNGAIALTQRALPHLASGGAIVNVASALALGGCNGFSVYSASKAGMIGFTQSLAWELAPRGIRVVAVAPGLVHTPMVHKHAEHLTPEVWKQIEACHPLGMGRPHDVAAAVAFLASDDARWITGITLPLGWCYGYPLPTHAMQG
jgi:NAD(P)-dependent dehydrogenase (short-subunit alcohol dehydrogenase family)